MTSFFFFLVMGVYKFTIQYFTCSTMQLNPHQYELLKSQNDYQNYKSNKWHLNLAALASYLGFLII